MQTVVITQHRGNTMAMILLRGEIESIGATEQKTEKLSIMKFVLSTDDGPIEIEVMNKSIEFFLKSRKVGDKVGVNLEIKGRHSNYNGKDNYFVSFRHANSFPIFTRGDESPNYNNGMAGGSPSYGADNSNGGFQKPSGYGETTQRSSIPPEDDIPF